MYVDAFLPFRWEASFALATKSVEFWKYICFNGNDKEKQKKSFFAEKVIQQNERL